MQLFSIGLWKLNADGTRARDENTNDLIPTYDNDDVVVYARVFTGFDRAPSRGNTESPGGITTANLYDPLVLKPIWKDNNPKTKLESGYLGEECRYGQRNCGWKKLRRERLGESCT